MKKKWFAIGFICGALLATITFMSLLIKFDTAVDISQERVEKLLTSLKTAHDDTDRDLKIIQELISKLNDSIELTNKAEAQLEKTERVAAEAIDTAKQYRELLKTTQEDNAKKQ